MAHFPLFALRLLCWTGLSLGLPAAYAASDCALPFRIKATIPMNFIYGEGRALPKRPEMRSLNTFDAILAGERTSTSRKNRSLDKIEVGDYLRFIRDEDGTDGEIIAQVLVKRTLEDVEPSEWAWLEGYDESAVESNWEQGKQFSKYRFQIIYKVVAFRANKKLPFTRRAFPRHPYLKTL